MRRAGTGEIRLLGAHIGGQLSFSNATLTNDSGPALNADGLQVDRNMFCDESFSATGEIRLLGAQIGGQLSFRDATLTNDSGPALNADSLQVDQEMICDESFSATGEIRLLGAHIGARLSFHGARLTGEYISLHVSDAAARTVHLDFAARPPARSTFLPRVSSGCLSGRTVPSKPGRCTDRRLVATTTARVWERRRRGQRAVAGRRSRRIRAAAVRAAGGCLPARGRRRSRSARADRQATADAGTNRWPGQRRAGAGFSA